MTDTTTPAPEVAPVRLVLRESTAFGFVADGESRRGAMKPVHVIAVYPIANGRAARTPSATLTADSRSDVLRLLADWIDDQDDADLTALAERG